MAELNSEVKGSLNQDTPASAQAPATRDGHVQDTPKPQRKRPQRPNYALIHSKPLPLDVHPLPAFIPQNPLSLLRLAAVILKQFFSPPTSHPANPCIGIFSPETRSVHVTDSAHIRALWEMGFFGKGTLSRSEPSWLEREKARLKAGKMGGGTAEEATRKRREERKLFKLERARAEREQIEEQLRQERVSLEAKKVEDTSKESEEKLSHVFPWMQNEVTSGQSVDAVFKEETRAVDAEQLEVDKPTPAAETTEKLLQSEPLTSLQAPQEETEITVDINHEHLQLNLEESFFLSYALGALRVQDPNTSAPLSTPELLALFRQHSYFPSAPTSSLRPDDPFLLNYIVYHYYRSLGWVVRPGVKFSCDFLLYNRGPVFSHAEFALLIIPEYEKGSKEELEGKGKMGWWWLHCVNRVQSQVKKSLVIVYVQVPRELPAMEEMDIGKVLRAYKVREFVVRRWLANRSRD